MDLVHQPQQTSAQSVVPSRSPTPQQFTPYTVLRDGFLAHTIGQRAAASLLRALLSADSDADVDSACLYDYQRVFWTPDKGVVDYLVDPAEGSVVPQLMPSSVLTYGPKLMELPVHRPPQMPVIFESGSRQPGLFPSTLLSPDTSAILSNDFTIPGRFLTVLIHWPGYNSWTHTAKVSISQSGVYEPSLPFLVRHAVGLFLAGPYSGRATLDAGVNARYRLPLEDLTVRDVRIVGVVSTPRTDIWMPILSVGPEAMHRTGLSERPEWEHYWRWTERLSPDVADDHRLRMDTVPACDVTLLGIVDLAGSSTWTPILRLSRTAAQRTGLPESGGRTTGGGSAPGGRTASCWGNALAGRL